MMQILDIITQERYNCISGCTDRTPVFVDSVTNSYLRIIPESVLDVIKLCTIHIYVLVIL